MTLECHERSHEKFSAVRQRHELDPSQIGLFGIFDLSGSLVIGVFVTGFIYNRIAPLAPETQLLQLTLIIVSICLPILSLIGKVTGSEWLYSQWRDNESWCILILQFAKAIKATCFFLCSHFAYALIVGYFTSSRCSLLECLALIPVVVVSFHFLHCMLRPRIH